VDGDKISAERFLPIETEGLLKPASESATLLVNCHPPATFTIRFVFIYPINALIDTALSTLRSHNTTFWVFTVGGKLVVVDQ
jgi:O-antigen ligase